MTRRVIRRRSERGSAVVDFVLVSVILVPLFLMILQIGLFLYVRNTVTAAASDGARLAATADRTPADGIERTESMIDRAVSSDLVEAVDSETTEIDGQPAVAIVVRVRMPALAFWGPTVAEFTVRGHAIEERP